MNDDFSLLDCFGIDTGIRTVAIVGAGGKTSLMYALAGEITAAGEKVVTTTTTKIFPPAPDQCSCVMFVSDDPELKQLPERLTQWGHVTLGQCLEPSTGKLTGISEETVRRCLTLTGKIIVEADGAAGRPVKAPEGWEPVIPQFTDLVIPVIGLDCLGKPVSQDWVFRLERFLEVTGLRTGEIIRPAAIAALLTHPLGSLKGIPETATVVPFLNKTDQLEEPRLVAEVVDLIGRRSAHIRIVVAGCLRGRRSARTYRIAARTA